MKYFSKNHSRFLLKYHLIFVVKYRKQLLDNKLCDKLTEYITQKFVDFSVDFIGYDCDHMHLMINSTPKLSPLQIVRKLKQETTILLWENFNLSKYFWKKNIFWSSGYFVCSCGEVSSDIIEKYIQNQGGNSSTKLKM